MPGDGPLLFGSESHVLNNRERADNLQARRLLFTFTDSWARQHAHKVPMLQCLPCVCLHSTSQILIMFCSGRARTQPAVDTSDVAAGAKRCNMMMAIAAVSFSFLVSLLPFSWYYALYTVHTVCACIRSYCCCACSNTAVLF
jgi:hypothetical protein